MKIDNLLSRLNGVKRNGNNGWLALCPGHNDHEPSLSIAESDGKILLHCYAGCELADILKPLNLEAKDLFLNSSETTGGYTVIVKLVNLSTPPGTRSKRLDTPDATLSTGVNLHALAEAKRLAWTF